MTNNLFHDGINNASRNSFKVFNSGSSQLLNIQWNKHFPFKLNSDELLVEYSNFDEGLDFIKKHYGDLFSTDEASQRFLIEEFSETKINYYKLLGDFFIFRHYSRPIGLFIGSPTDWNSYYLRSCALLPEYRGESYYQTFFSYLLEVLSEYPIDRAEGDVPPSNLKHIHIFNKNRFHITGFNVSERWGAVVHFTKFLNRKNCSIFLKQFCISKFSTEA